MEKGRQTEKPKNEREGLIEFKKLIKDWQLFDGDQFCPDCWPMFLSRFPSVQQEQIKKDTCPLADYAEHNCRASDGWFAACEKCRRTASL